MAALIFTIPLKVNGITVAEIKGVADIRPDEDDFPTLKAVALDGVDADGKRARRVLSFDNQLHRLVTRSLWQGQYEGLSFAEAVEGSGK